jgi:hypothetical protein
MDKMQELEGKLKESEEMRLMNTSLVVPEMIPGQTGLSTRTEVGCVYNGLGRSK